MYIDIFAVKMWVAFALTFLKQKYQCIWNPLATTVKEFVINKLIKLTMLWATGAQVSIKTPYHVYPKMWISFDYLMMCL